MIANEEIVIRLLAAAALGALVGFDRERHNQPAGLRTHVILAVGSALAMVLSITLPVSFHAVTGTGDPARLAAQVVSGIGFLGAGAILRYGTNVRGLTTAASLWTVAIVGLAAGAGLYFAALGTTLLLLFSLVLLSFLEKRFIHPTIDWEVNFQCEDSAEVVAQFRQAVAMLGRKVKALGYSKNVAENALIIEATVEAPETENIHAMVEQLSTLPGVRLVRVHS